MIENLFTYYLFNLNTVAAFVCIYYIEQNRPFPMLPTIGICSGKPSSFL